MKKLLFALLAIFLMAGAVYAVSIPQSEDATVGPYIWTQPVYAAAALDVGDVVIWDIGSSTGDDDNWVATTTTAATGIVAGVVYGSGIDAGGTGIIVTRGIVNIDTDTPTGVNIVSGTILCTGTTAGGVAPCSTKDAEAFRIGVAVASTSNGSVKAFIGAGPM